MDLALHLGTTVAGLKRSMSEGEFRDWQRYAGSNMLPLRRIELMLAQLARFVHVGMCGGDKNAKLADYLFEPVDAMAEEGDGEITAEDVAAQFGGSVYRKAAT